MSLLVTRSEMTAEAKCPRKYANATHNEVGNREGQAKFNSLWSFCVRLFEMLRRRPS